MKLPVNLENYPNLLELFHKDQKQLKNILIDTFKFMDASVGRKDHEQVKAVFDMEYTDFVRDLVAAFLDYEGITGHHPIEKEAELLQMLEHENNPLLVFTGKADCWDFDGNTMTPKEFIGDDLRYFNLKNWLQGLLYATRYLPHESYVKYMTLGKYDLIEGMKYANVEKLIKIQPALQYQKENELPIGKFLPGSSYFDCGPYNDTAKQTFPSVIPLGSYMVDQDTKAGFYNE